MQAAGKVGAFVVLFVVLLFGAYAVLGRTVLRPKTYDLVAEFPNAGGVTTGVAVQLAGVSVGQVADVALAQTASGPLARVTLRMNEGIQVPNGTVAQLPQSLVGFGSNPIELIPPSNPGSPLAAGATLPGRLGGPLDSILPQFQPTLDELNATLVETRKLIGDQKLRDQVGQLLTEVTDTSRKFGELASRIDQTLAQNQPELRTAARNVALAMDNIQQATRRVNQLVASGKLQGEAEGLLKQLTAAAKRGEQLIASLDEMVSDPELRNNLRRTTENVAEITETGKRVALNGEEISRNGAAASARVVEITDKTNLLLDDVKGMVQRVDRFFNRGAGQGQGLLPTVQAEASISRSSAENRLQTDFNFRTNLAGQDLHFGLKDAFETNRLNLQFGRPLGPSSTLRYGVFASKPGVGVDYSVASGFRLRGDLYDLNRPRLDLRATYDFGNGVFGWAGLERAFERNAPAVGIGIRR